MLELQGYDSEGDNWVSLETIPNKRTAIQVIDTAHKSKEPYLCAFKKWRLLNESGNKIFSYDDLRG